MAAYNKRHHPLIFNVILALYLKQSKRRAVLELSTNSTDHPSTDKDDANDVVRPSRVGELIADTLINKETAAVRLNRNTTLSEAFAERLARKSTTIYSLGDNARQAKLVTILKEDSKEEKDNDAPKSNNNTFNTPIALEEYINLAAKAVEEGEDRLHFQVVNPAAGLTDKEVIELLDYNFAIQLEDRVLLVDKIFKKIKGKNVKTKYLTKENWSLIYIIFKRDKNDFKT